jgi:uncharacterized membrane protein
LAPIALVTLLGVGLRLYRLDAQSLWYDEGISAHQLTRSYAEIVAAAGLDTHPPLYYWTLKAWAGLFGATEVGLRSLSVFWGGAAVVLTWLIGRRAFGSLVGWCAALLLACSPLAIYYSQEVRMYAQVTALGLLAAWAYLRRWHPLYVAAGAATLYTQYLGAAFLIAINAHWLLTAAAGGVRSFLERGAGVRPAGLRGASIWLGANLAIALLFLPWLPTFVAQQSHDLNVSPRTASTLVLSTLGAYGGGVANGDLSLLGGLVLVALAAVGILLCWRTSLLTALLWLVPLGLVLGLGLRSGLFELRYLDLGVPGLVLLAAAGIVRLSRVVPAAVAVAAVALAPAVPALQRQYFDPALFRDDYRGVVQAIIAQAQPSDAILLSAPNQSEVFNFYYHGPLAVVPLPAQRPIDPADTQRRLEALKAQHPRAWVVEWAMQEADPRGVIATWLAQNGFQASHAWYGTLQLALVSFSSADEPSQQVNLSLDNGVVLVSYRARLSGLQPGDTLPVTLVWRAEQSPGPVPWKVFTHVLDDQQHVVAQRDSEPVDRLQPTTQWQPGEVVEDHYGITLPPDLAPGAYILEIGMYQGDHRATFLGRGDHLILGRVEVEV